MSFTYTSNGQTRVGELNSNSEKSVYIIEDTLADDKIYYELMASTSEEAYMPGVWACRPTRTDECIRVWIPGHNVNRITSWFNLMLQKTDNRYTFYRLDAKDFAFPDDFAVAPGARCRVVRD